MSPGRLVAIAAALACCACGRHAARERMAAVAGTYTMLERDGGRLPHVMRAEDPNCQSELVSDVLTLRPDGSAEDVTDGRVWCGSDPRPQATDSVRATGSFQLQGSGNDIVITISDPGPPERMTGTVEGNEIHLIGQTMGGQQLRSYRYVRARKGG
jgi:hypothetical protein